jgi:hypothetical protein
MSCSGCPRGGGLISGRRMVCDTPLSSKDHFNWLVASVYDFQSWFHLLQWRGVGWGINERTGQSNGWGEGR